MIIFKYNIVVSQQKKKKKKKKKYNIFDNETF